MTDITDEQIAAWEAQDDYDYQLISRIEKLEKLCLDMYFNSDYLEPVYNDATGEEEYPYTRRIIDLGLLDEK